MDQDREDYGEEIYDQPGPRTRWPVTPLSEIVVFGLVLLASLLPCLFFLLTAWSPPFD